MASYVTVILRLPVLNNFTGNNSIAIIDFFIAIIDSNYILWTSIIANKPTVYKSGI